MRGERHHGGQGHRGDRLAEQIREEVSQIVGYELRDERVGFATVTDVRMMPDLSSARVYVSLLGDAAEQTSGLAALNRAAGYVRKQLAPRIRTKRVPALIFELDDLLERGSRIENLLKEDEDKPAAPSEPPAK
ncbi:MAG: 30S ribosome-binding factor RbfA [Acidobacteria bacterium]|nr:30S ribosome-binding factor RbfA [Acidobacteriota bacterium]